MRKFISWRRVSTKRQGASGLGLEAQSDIIDYFVNANEGELIADYCEVYTGTDLSGCSELRAAIKQCRETGATLIIAKSDRFRNLREALSVLDEVGEGNFFSCDIPNCDRFTLSLWWAMAEREALLISVRTKAALKVNKARGIASGRANENYTVNEGKQKSGRQKQAVTRNRMTVESEDFVAFARIMRRIFKVLEDNSTDGRLFFLKWHKCRYDIKLDAMVREAIINEMKYIHQTNSSLFSGMDFEDSRMHQFVNNRIRCMFDSIRKYNEFNEVSV